VAVVLLGLDGEMSGSEIQEGHVLIQIGAAFSATERFSSLLGYPKDSYPSTEVAMNVHGFTPSQIERAPSPKEVDDLFYAWLTGALEKRGLDTKVHRLIPVGFNVGGFDLPFIKKFLPRSYSLLSRRVVDLNAFLFSYADRRVPYQGATPKWSGWKRLAVAAAKKELRDAGVKESAHDAGYDALEALEVLKFLLDATTA
jgi:DNA polymerase III epsilon subunit-like protein